MITGYDPSLLCIALALLADSLSQIPKPNEEQGLGVGWPTQKIELEELKAYFEEVKSKM